MLDGRKWGLCLLGDGMEKEVSLSEKEYETVITALQTYQPWISVEDRPRKDNKYLPFCNLKVFIINSMPMKFAGMFIAATC